MVPACYHAATELHGMQVDELKRAIKNREAMLSPLYMQIAHSFADLHDTPGRMLVSASRVYTRVALVSVCVFAGERVHLPRSPVEKRSP